MEVLIRERFEAVKGGGVPEMQGQSEVSDAQAKENERLALGSSDVPARTSGSFSCSWWGM